MLVAPRGLPSLREVGKPWRRDLRRRDAFAKRRAMYAARGEVGYVEPVVLAPPAPLTLEAVGRIAAGAPVVLGADVAARCAASLALLRELDDAGRTVYGLNTGCGPLC